jgi:hypothetical protein
MNLRLNGGPDYDPALESLLAAASSTKKKPTFRIKRWGSKRCFFHPVGKRETRKSFET